MNNYPVFAVIGKTNKGKSTLVATLTEDETIQIAYEEGTTTETKCYPYKHNNKKLFALCDTPGFENQRKMLSELKKSMENIPKDDTPVHLRHFYDLYENRKQFNFGMETEILKPIFNGAAIIYVVKGTDPFSKSVMTEIEILKWANRPMLAILNIDIEGNESESITENQRNNLRKWEVKLRKDFNIVKQFNPFRPTVEDKMELLDAMKHLDTTWKKDIEQVKVIMLRSTCDRIHETAEVFTELMQEALKYQDSTIIERGQKIKGLLKSLEAQYKKKIQKIEETYFKKIKNIWRHQYLSENIPEMEKTKLFSRESHKLIEKEMIYLSRGASGAAVGAILGASIDLLSLGITLGGGAALGATIGTLLGAGEAWTEIENINDMEKVKYFSKKFSIGGKQAPDELPLELFFRALSFSLEVAGRSHGNRSKIDIREERKKIDDIEMWEQLHKKFKKNTYSNADTERYRDYVKRVLIEEILGERYKHVCSD